MSFTNSKGEGKGCNGTVTFGGKATTLKDLKQDLGPGLLSAMLKQLGIDKERILVRWDMRELTYPVEIIPEDNGTYYAQFPDVPGALTGGKDEAETLAEAQDALGVMLAHLMKKQQDIPRPSKAKRGQHLVSVPLYLAPKLALYCAVRDQKITKSELARKLGVRETVVRRLLDPEHDSKPDKVQAALAAVGKTLVVSVQDAA